MIYILIFTFVSRQGSATTGTVEFHSMASCQSAAKVIKDSGPYRMDGDRFAVLACAAKGTP